MPIVLIDLAVPRHAIPHRHRKLAWTAAILIACAIHPAVAALRSPWDTNVPLVPAPAHCPDPPVLSPDLDTADYYRDAAHSVVDPARLAAYRQAVAPIWATARIVVDTADRFRAMGHAADARCVAHWLARFAAEGGLTGRMSTNQAVYVQGWMLGAFAVAWLKVRQAEPAESQAGIITWLARLAEETEACYRPRAGKTDGRNNHRYWAGFAVMAAGIAANRPDLFDWGLDSFRIGVDQITPAGTLPLEMARRSRALHYHLFAAAPLVMMAELAAANGLDLYAEDDDALVRLVDHAVAGIRHPQAFATAASVAQEPIKLNADSLGWAVPFARRFHNPELDALLAALPSDSMLYIGGDPPVPLAANRSDTPSRPARPTPPSSLSRN